MVTMTKSRICLLTVLALVDGGLCRSAELSQQQSGDSLQLGFRKELVNKAVNGSNNVPDKFITGGSPTGIAQYPWLAHLIIKYHEWVFSKLTQCGGSLISSRHVITAAHCLDFNIRAYEDVSIYLSEYNTATFPRDCVGTQCIENVLMHPDRITVHPKYNRYQFHNDIAMLRLRRPAPNNGYIRPIPLPTFNINTSELEGIPLIISGWGQTEYSQASPIKLHTQVQLLAPRTCRQQIPVTEGMLCAIGRNRQDSCFGDSGGPIMVKREGNFHLVGIVSFGVSGQCGTSKPTVYTNVFSYLDWIQNSMRV